MPSYAGVASEEDVIRLVAYLRSGKVMAGTPAPAPAPAPASPAEVDETRAKAQGDGR